MDKHSAKTSLSSEQLSTRLRAARYLAKHASPEDRESLLDAFGREAAPWVKEALKIALETAGVDVPEGPETGLEERRQEAADQASEVIRAAARLFLHEVRGPVGRIDVYAGNEFDDYAESKTKDEVELLKMKMEAIEKLSKAAATPAPSEMDLGALIQRLITSLANEDVDVRAAGQDHLIIHSDESLIEMMVSQGLRNAIEASQVVEHERQPVIVSWGKTDRDYWVRIADRGPGTSQSFEELSTLGKSLKRSHAGYGLAIAGQAAISLNGTVTLRRRGEGGAVYECRWPISSSNGL